MRGRKPNFIACVHCRQMKLACDRSQKFPAACSRCTKTGRICSVDPSFKRTKQRERFTAVERELRDIKESLKTHDDPESTDLKLGDGSPTHPLPYIHNPISTSDAPLDAEIFEVDLPPSALSIQGVQLPSELVKELLQEFFIRYHPFWPILPGPSKFIKYSEPCPLLFSTVLVIALRGKTQHRDLFAKMADVVIDMAYDVARPEHNKSLHSMQALLLLCHWPLPFQRDGDNSLTFISLATNIGLRLGLHRPRYSTEFVNESSIDAETEVIRQTAWVGCFITNMSVNIRQGLPPTIRLDKCLLDILANKPAWLPDLLYNQFHISRQAFNICSTLGSCESSSTGLLPEPKPVIRIFDTELRALESRFSSAWSPADYIMFLGCRMVLYTFALTSDSLENKSSGIEFSSHWLIQCYMICIAAIKTASSIRKYLSFAPTRFQKVIVNSVCFLLLLKCSRSNELVEYSELCDGISKGWESIRHWTITSDDFMSRASRFIERLSKCSDTMDPQAKAEKLLLVKSRMGANVSLTTVLRAKEYLSKSRDQSVPQDREEATESLDAGDANFFPDIDWDLLFSDRGI